MEKPSCIVVGAGPAGLSAAIAAARGGWSVVLLEKNDQPGRKLLLTGGGRANLLDPAAPALDALESYGRSGRFLRQALAAFRPAEFLTDLGVETEREEDGARGGTTYVRGGSRRLLDALLTGVCRAGAEIVYGAPVEAARAADGTFHVRAAGRDRTCRRLIIATGGVTYPSTGSCGDGYRLAETFGHEVEPARPALGAMTTAPSFPQLAGVSVADASLTLRRDGGRIGTRRGALLFTHHGLSGPAVLDLSLELARASALPEDARGVEIVADLLPDASREQIVAEFLAAGRATPRRQLGNAGLGASLPARLVAELAGRAGMDPTRPVGQVPRRELGALAERVKALVMIIREPLGPAAAMVTVGGVVTRSLDPRTMESRLAPGLRFAGELLAPAGPCGGYNLLMAFATGWAAGR